MAIQGVAAKWALDKVGQKVAERYNLPPWMKKIINKRKKKNSSSSRAKRWTRNLISLLLLLLLLASCLTIPSITQSSQSVTTQEELATIPSTQRQFLETVAAEVEVPQSLLEGISYTASDFGTSTLTVTPAVTAASDAVLNSAGATTDSLTGAFDSITTLEDLQSAWAAAGPMEASLISTAGEAGLSATSLLADLGTVASDALGALAIAAVSNSTPINGASTSTTVSSNTLPAGYARGAALLGIYLKLKGEQAAQKAGVSYASLYQDPYSSQNMAIWQQIIDTMPLSPPVNASCYSGASGGIVNTIYQCGPYVQPPPTTTTSNSGQNGQNQGATSSSTTTSSTTTTAPSVTSPTGQSTSNQILLASWSSVSNEAFTMAQYLAGMPGVNPFASSSASFNGNVPIINPTYYSVYKDAATQICPNMPWELIAAVAQQESSQNPNDINTATGLPINAPNSSGQGYMQIAPATFNEYAPKVSQFVGKDNGVIPMTVTDPVDSIYVAAQILCSDGASNGNIYQALQDYNCGNPSACPFGWSYGNDVEGYLQLFETEVQSGGAVTNPTILTVLNYARTQVANHVPYVWGGTTTNGFDCSGLVQAAYSQANVALPRTAQDQFNATYSVSSPQPGDLVFFGSSTTTIDHVGIYIGPDPKNPSLAMMINAPTTGLDIQYMDFSPTIGAAWDASNGLYYMGAHRVILITGTTSSKPIA